MSFPLGQTLFSALARSPLLGLAAVDEHGRQTYVSPGFCTLLGFTADELLGRSPPFAYWPPEELPTIRAALEQTLLGNTPDEGFLLRFARKDGSRLAVRLILSAIQDGDQRGWLATVIDLTERARAEAQLLRRERLLSEAQRMAHVGSWEWDLLADRITWSDEMFRLFGLEPAAPDTVISYDTYLSRIPAEDRVDLQAAVARCLETGEGYTVRHRVALPDGGVRFLLGRGELERDDEGKPRRLFGTGQDLVEVLRHEEERARLSRERALHAQAEAERVRLRSILESLPSGVVLAEASGAIVYANAAAKQIFGGDLPSPRDPGSDAQTYAAWDATGTPLRSEDYPLVRALRGERVAGHELDVRWRDGTSAHIRISAEPLRDAAGLITGAVTAYYDVAELRAAQRETENERSQLARTLLQAPVAIAVLRGEELRYASANARYEQMVGRRGLEGKTVHEAMPELPGDHPVYRAMVRAHGGESVQETEMLVAIRRQEGGPIEDAWFNFVVEPLRDVEGTVEGSMVVAIDVTEQVLARQKVEVLRQEAEASSRAKDEFLAILGHELRNPLAPMVTALQLLRMRGSREGERERELIERQVHHLLRLVDDMLDISRVTSGKVELRREPLDVAELVSRAVELANPLFDERRQHLAIRVAPGLVVNGDLPRLAQTLGNLLTNAAKYTDRGGHIVVRADPEGDEVRIEVQDDGIGIASSLLPRVFDLFVQGGRGIDRRQGGLGLGLAIVRSLAELHGGRVAVASEGVGKGSTFTLWLPRLGGAAAQRGGKTPTPVQVENTRLGKRVLVVDDNEDAAFLLAEGIGALGHDVRVCHDAPSALAEASVFGPEVALLDLGLPVMDGFELARRLRALPETQDALLVAITGYGQASDRARAREAGFDVHLVKPVDLQEVFAVLMTTREQARRR